MDRKITMENIAHSRKANVMAGADSYRYPPSAEELEVNLLDFA